eukprot:6196968-Pleurochrysis_carterae.AAC.2
MRAGARGPGGAAAARADGGLDAGAHARRTQAAHARRTPTRTPPDARGHFARYVTHFANAYLHCRSPLLHGPLPGRSREETLQQAAPTTGLACPNCACHAHPLRYLHAPERTAAISHHLNIGSLSAFEWADPVSMVG